MRKIHSKSSALVTSLGADSDKLSYGQFCDALGRARIFADDTLLRAAFSDFDVSHTNQLTYEDFRRKLRA